MGCNDGPLKNQVCNGRRKQYSTVERGGHGGEVILAHPAVTNGKSDSQKRRWRFAHRMRPLTRVHACSIW